MYNYKFFIYRDLAIDNLFMAITMPKNSKFRKIGFRVFSTDYIPQNSWGDFISYQNKRLIIVNRELFRA